MKVLPPLPEALCSSNVLVLSLGLSPVSPRSAQEMVVSSLYLQVNLKKKGSHCTSIFSCLSDAMKSLYSSG